MLKTEIITTKNIIFDNFCNACIAFLKQCLREAHNCRSRLSSGVGKHDVGVAVAVLNAVVRVTVIVDRRAVVFLVLVARPVDQVDAAGRRLRGSRINR